MSEEAVNETSVKKYCVNCAFYRPIGELCRKESNPMDLVTGKRWFTQCCEERCEERSVRNDTCGSEGFYFKPKGNAVC